MQKSKIKNIFADVTFTNADGEPVAYDGSPVNWRISAYAVIIEDEQILLIKSQADQLFDVVGGGIELGETVEAALTREALEEAGAQISLGSLLGFHQDFFYHRGEGKFYQTVLLYFRARLVGELGEPSDKKIVWRDFVPLSELDQYPMLGYLREVVEGARKND